MFLWKLIESLLDTAWWLDRWGYQIRHWRLNLALTVGLVAAGTALGIWGTGQGEEVLAVVIIAAALIWGFYWEDIGLGK